MATDATGAPTTLGIPKIDPDADAPSGLGTNAGFDAVDTLISGRIAKPAGIVTGEVPVWNGASWDRSTVTKIGATSLNIPLTTTSTMAGGPPGSPSDKDIWIATAVDANGTRWAFQYNAGSGSAFKWEFIGGSPAVATVATSETTASISAFVDTATVGPSITIARAGDYDWQATALATSPAGSVQTFIGLKPGAGSVSGSQGAAFMAVGGISGQQMAAQDRLTGAVAATALKLQVNINVANNGWSNRTLRVTPVRIS